MSSPWYARRRRLRLAAVGVAFFLAAAVAYDIVGAQPTYVESATVVFSLPRHARTPAAYEMFAPSLITSGQAMSQLLMSAQMQRKIHEAAGTGSVSMRLVNLYDEEYPNYGEPLATLTSASPSAVAAHRTFAIAVRRLYRLLAAWQARASVRPRHRISAQIVDDTGPLVQKGSGKRVIGGIAILAMVGVSALWRIVDWSLGS
jgi:hypothetical protein